MGAETFFLKHTEILQHISSVSYCDMLQVFGKIHLYTRTNDILKRTNRRRKELCNTFGQQI